MKEKKRERKKVFAWVCPSSYNVLLSDLWHDYFLLHVGITLEVSLPRGSSPARVYSSLPTTCNPVNPILVLITLDRVLIYLCGCGSCVSWEAKLYLYDSELVPGMR